MFIMHEIYLARNLYSDIKDFVYAYCMPTFDTHTL